MYTNMQHSIQGTKNQYSEGGISACTVLSLEALVKTLCLGCDLSPELVDSILEVGCVYKNSLHVELQEVVEHVERYNKSLELIRPLEDVCDQTSFANLSNHATDAP